MLASVFGSRSAERVLLFLAAYGEGYATEIARTFGMTVGMAKNQLEKLEAGGVLVSRQRGRTRLYAWNPRFALRAELEALLLAELELLPEAERREWFGRRTRPRRKDKP